MKTILRYARKFFTNRKSGFIGLDINESYIAMAEITCAKNHHYCLEDFAFVPFLQQQAVHETYQQDVEGSMSPFSNPDAMHHLSSIFAHSSLLAKNIALAMPLNLVTSKTLTFPCQLKAKEIAAALKLRLNNSDEFDYRQHSDSALPENDERVINIRRLHCDAALNEEMWLIVAASKSVVRTYVDSLRHVSLPLKATVLDVDIYACARAAIFLKLSPKNLFVIANINAKNIQFALVVNSNIVEISEYNFDRSESINVTALRQEVIVQITCEKIQTFLQTIKHSAETIILCGPNATPKLKQSLSSLINIDVILADPFQYLELGEKLKTTENRNINSDNNYSLPGSLNSIGPQMMLCCGLSLHGAGAR